LDAAVSVLHVQGEEESMSCMVVECFGDKPEIYDVFFGALVHDEVVDLKGQQFYGHHVALGDAAVLWIDLPSLLMLILRAVVPTQFSDDV
jgi:hypothetical protein